MTEHQTGLLGELSDRPNRLPADHPSDHLDPVASSESVVIDCLKVVRKAGIAPRLEDAQMARPGPKTALSAEAVLTACLVSGILRGSQRATEVSRVLAGLDPSVARKLGLLGSDSGRQISYRVVARQVRSLRQALLAGRPDPEPGEIGDVAWAVDRLVAASMPPAAPLEVGTLAADRALFPAKATAGTWQPEGDGGPTDRWAAEIAATIVVAAPPGQHTAQPWILAISVDDASNPDLFGMGSMRRAIRLAPNAAAVVAARAAVRQASSFVRLLDASGIKVFMGCPRQVVGQPPEIEVVGPGGIGRPAPHCRDLLGRLRAAENLARQLPVGPEATSPRAPREEDLAARAISAGAFAVAHNLVLAERYRQARAGGSR